MVTFKIETLVIMKGWKKKNVTILELEQTSKKSVVIASQVQKIIKLKEID